MWLVGSKPTRSNVTMLTTSFLRVLCHRKFVMLELSIFRTNDVMCRALLHQLSSFPYQFSIFEDMGVDSPMSRNVGCFLRLLRHHYLINACTWTLILVFTSCCRLQNWKVANYVKLLQITSTCIFQGCHHGACLMSCAQRRGLDPREGW